MLTKKEQIIELQQRSDYRKHARTCSDCHFFKKSKDQDDLSDIDLCLFREDLKFRTTANSSCNNWVF